MNINIKELSRLAHLSLTEEEERRFSEELEGVLAFLVQTAATTPSDEETPAVLSPVHEPREDISIPFPAPERILALAPDTAQGLIRVPAVLRDE